VFGTGQSRARKGATVGVRGNPVYVLKNKERWELLCEQAAKEQDPEKLLALTNEINLILEEKERRLRGASSSLPETYPSVEDGP
jgi:hypothetical protein